MGQYTQVDPIGLAGGNPTLYGYVFNPFAQSDVLGLRCSNSGGYRVNDVNKHSELSPQANRAPGHGNNANDGFVQSHHFIQQEWVVQNLSNPNALNRNAPAILLRSASGEPHALISALQRSRRALGGYGNTLRQEFQKAFSELLASGVPRREAQRLARQAYKFFEDLF